MRTTTVAAVTDVLPALATLSTGATKTRRAGKAVRLYRAETNVVETPELRGAITMLLKAGYPVKVYESERVYYPRLAGDGTLLWSTRDTTKKRDYSCVEVML